MAVVRKFLFDRSFDIAESEPDAVAEAADAAGSVAEPEPPPPPTFTEEELAAARDEADAAGRLCPGVDGVLLEWRGHCATFLPQVWAQLPQPAAAALGEAIERLNGLLYGPQEYALFARR